MKRSIKTVAIEGAYGQGNFGDDALMIATIGLIKREFKPESILLMCKHSAYLERFIEPDCRLYKKDDEGKIDLIVYGGGTQHFAFPKRQPVSGEPKELFDRAKNSNGLRHIKYWIKKINRFITRKPKICTIGIGIGIGPFLSNNTNEMIAKDIYQAMQFIAVRDPESLKILNKWNLKSNKIYSDICYSPNLWPALESVSHTAIELPIKKIGVIVRDWPHTSEGNAYADSLDEVVRNLRSNGKEVKFIIFAPSSDKAWINKMKENGELFETWAPDESTVSEFLKTLSSYDLFITARYHGAVFASLLKKPVICIEVEQKLRMVSELLEDGARLWEQPFAASKCIDLIDQIENNRKVAAASIDRAVNAQRALAEEMILDARATLLQTRK